MSKPQRSRIEIHRRTASRNTVGEVVYEFEKICETWAELRGDIVTIRYQRDLMPGYRVIIGDEILEIVSVRDILQPTRLVELGVKPLGTEQVCLSRFGRDEQLVPRAFPRARAKRGNDRGSP